MLQTHCNENDHACTMLKIQLLKQERLLNVQCSQYFETVVKFYHYYLLTFVIK